MRRLVAYQGTAGAFGEVAIRTRWPNEADAVGMVTFAEVVRAVSEGRVAAGVLPIENSIVGTLLEAAGALSEGHNVRVVGETVLSITQCLVAPHGSSIALLRTVESHPAALAQCSEFLQRHPYMKVVTAFDTAGAARDVAEANDCTRAAIASRRAAETYGLAILAEGIANDPVNETRFVVIERANGAHGQLARRRPWRRVHAVRGATTVEADEADLIRDGTRDLLRCLLQRNDLHDDEIVSALFTVTPDLTSEFPARAARDLGWTDVALMCMTEIAVPGAQRRCIRVMLHIESQELRGPLTPVYLRGAAALRPDLAPHYPEKPNVATQGIAMP
ncbi:MAG: chorismate mutase [Gemmatimonadota bacterium]